MKRFLVVLLLLVALSTSAVRAPKGYAGRLYAGTLALYFTQKDVSRFICTTEPFEKITGGYHLVSAGHCVQGVPPGGVFSVADFIGGPLTPVKMMKAYRGDGLDFSEFELKTKRDYPVFVLGDEKDARIGDPTINPNFAAGLGKQLSLGWVASSILGSSSRCFSADDCMGDFIVQTFDAPGASGSAIVDARTHTVIGILVWQFDDALGFGVKPISLFYKFLAGPGQPHPVEHKTAIIMIFPGVEDE